MVILYSLVFYIPRLSQLTIGSCFAPMQIKLSITSIHIISVLLNTFKILETCTTTAVANLVNYVSFVFPRKKIIILIFECITQVYPTHDITNIVESSHFVKINNWCKVGHSKCKRNEWVKPYRCLGKLTICYIEYKMVG